jgi:hypothetical protein
MASPSPPPEPLTFQEAFPEVRVYTLLQFLLKPFQAYILQRTDQVHFLPFLLVDKNPPLGPSFERYY